MKNAIGADAAMVKPEVGTALVEQLLSQHYGEDIHQVEMLSGGNLSAVFAYTFRGANYVIHLSREKDAYLVEHYISDLLVTHGVPYPRKCGLGIFSDDLHYSISERMDGYVFNDLSQEQKRALLPEVAGLMYDIHQVPIQQTAGFGFVQADGSAAHADWESYVIDVFAEDQTGTFWENWHELFDTTFLEKDVFDECYARLMHYVPYNAPHRYLVHNDFHAWNILTNGQSLVGVIDSNALYGDFLIDFAIAEDVVYQYDAVPTFKAFYEERGIELPDFEQRLSGARLYKGLDGLRFYAKMGWKDSYDHLKKNLLRIHF